MFSFAYSYSQLAFERTVVGSRLKDRYSTERFLYEKRKRKIERRLRRYGVQNGLYGTEQEQLLPSRIISLFQERNRLQIDGKLRKQSVTIPKKFSVIENPTGFIDALKAVAVVSRSSSVSELSFDYSKTVQIDLAAESILGCITREVESELDVNNRKLRQVGGLYPDRKYLKNIIRSLGTIKHLKIKHELIEEGDSELLKIFEASRGVKVSTLGTDMEDKKTKTILKFVEHINECLKSNGRELSEVGREFLFKSTGEVIGNAEDHTDQGEWTICGFLDNEAEGHTCEIAIFNFGRSIAESFTSLSPEDYARTQIQDVLLLHARKRFHGRYWQQDDLYTLLALQENISSKNKSQYDNHGTGTMDLINYFYELCGECDSNNKNSAKMAILSGSTHILFDGKYEVFRDQHQAQRITFNAEKSLEVPPDRAYVKHLRKHYFPGTIISIKIPMDSVSHKEESHD